MDLLHRLGVSPPLWLPSFWDFPESLPATFPANPELCPVTSQAGTTVASLVHGESPHWGVCTGRAASTQMSPCSGLTFQGSASVFRLRLLTVPYLPAVAFYICLPFPAAVCGTRTLAKESDHHSGSQTLLLLDLNISAIWGDIKCYPIVILILIFLITNEAHLFKNTFSPLSQSGGYLVLIRICIISVMLDLFHMFISHLYFLFWEMLLPILEQDLLLLLLICKNSSNTLGTNLLPSIYFADILCCGLSFHFP